MNRTIVSKVVLCIVVAFTLCAVAQNPRPRSESPDALWLREQARPFDPAEVQHETMRSAINGDPRFGSILARSFHQRQWFWFDHYRFTPLPKLIPFFMGVPGDAILDEKRYVTLDGCVPHDCEANRGVLWVDTRAHPARLVFAAVNVNGGNLGDTSHLWLFSSSKLDWQHLPAPFLRSMVRWRETIGASGYRQTHGYRYRILLATIVQPNGEQVDVSPALLHLDQSFSNSDRGAKQ